jgi:hypothetical protein
MHCSVGGKLNLERLTLTPLFTIDDEFFFDVLGDRINPATGLLDDPTPPFKLYLSNENQLENEVNPLRRRPLRIVGTDAITAIPMGAKIAPLAGLSEDA